MALATMGKFLELLRQTGGSYLAAALGSALFIKLALLFPGQRFYTGLKRYAFFSQLVENTRRACKKNHKPVNREIAQTLRKNKYPIWGFTGVYLIGTLAAVALTLPVLLEPELLESPEELVMLRGTLDLGRAPLKIWLSIPDNGPFFVSLALVLACVALQSLHTTCANRYLIIEQTKMDLVLILVTAVLSSMLPGFFSIIWLGIRALDFLHYWIVVKLMG